MTASGAPILSIKTVELNLFSPVAHLISFTSVTAKTLEIPSTRVACKLVFSVAVNDFSEGALLIPKAFWQSHDRGDVSVTAGGLVMAKKMSGLSWGRMIVVPPMLVPE